MIELRQTTEFQDWLNNLRDQRAIDRIVQRMTRLATGLLGDVKLIGQGVSELRISDAARAGADRASMWWRQAKPAA